MLHRSNVFIIRMLRQSNKMAFLQRDIFSYTTLMQTLDTHGTHHIPKPSITAYFSMLDLPWYLRELLNSFFL